MAQTVAVTGATGQIGAALVKHLRARGIAVRAIARSESRLSGLVGAGAEARAGSLEDASFLSKAFAGADVVFALIPPDYQAADRRAHQRRVGDAIATALERAGVPRAVDLSSVGAELSEGTGPIAGLHDAEKRLEAVPGLHVLHLRPTYFMENHLAGIGLIKGQGIYGSPLRGSLSFAMVATRDIASAAAGILSGAAFTGISFRELLGPRDYSMAEAAKILGASVGKPDLPYVEFPYDAALKAMVGLGLSADVARGFVEMYEAFNTGRVRPIQGRGPDTQTPTTLEAFAKEVFAPAFRA